VSGELAGVRVLVTGAGKGIGRATAVLLAAQGAQVSALSRSADDLASLQAEIGCRTLAVDLADGAATRSSTVPAPSRWRRSSIHRPICSIA
jgi:L-xylulose reductase